MSLMSFVSYNSEILKYMIETSMMMFYIIIFVFVY
ncbi:hypothetical protein BVRB_6g143280 [Beta vulgaris subsp. vulgaris]|nr:hypothetical protein BVRB_6g143280 [Beta vulgaris subsp. vulgaris]